MPDPILYEQDGPIVTITLNRPEMRNPISEAGMIDGLVAFLERLGADSDVRCAILTGAGSAFSSGGDLRKMHAALDTRANQPTLTPRYYTQGIQRIPLAFQKLDVPIIAAINGPAIGAGCDLACMCDIRIAGENARFAESFVKVGIIPGDGGAWLLPRVVGFSKACEMAFTGDALNAQEALACGLVSKVVPDAELLPTARAMAARIAANPPQAVRMTKRLMVQGRDMSLPAVLEMSAALQALAHTTADHREAVTAFLEKRPPVFTGR
ncbi:crotonase/enoyl-CoA hydratase family protein [Limobrevibacterium gyesilva]|uniref:Crotonase/enoyl-CoA hydratase family protein n=1 Tax=Limobrevibacterium gyesilva TaxID=2991712 RepID=A0AA41YRF5_9PROT|nr:crotonase/enoyl-CoA hydratase family protein [Limobrevibacterium gyesilva]MCW3476938.1 crotonase/enoyl-CoA hydratase family protein [Limobrevibacterium gyesilva]